LNDAGDDSTVAIRREYVEVVVVKP